MAKTKKTAREPAITPISRPTPSGSQWSLTNKFRLTLTMKYRPAFNSDWLDRLGGVEGGGGQGGERGGRGGEWGSREVGNGRSADSEPGSNR